MIVISLKISEELLEQVDLYAQKVNASRSEFIRRAIVEYLARLKEAERPKTRLVVIG